MLLALALWSDGDLESAQQHYADGMASLQRAGFVADVINSANTVAAMLVAQGRLHDAERTLQQALQRAVEHGERHPNGMADFLVGLGELRYEWNDLDAATSYLLRAQELNTSTGGRSSVRARVRRWLGSARRGVTWTVCWPTSARRSSSGRRTSSRHPSGRGAASAHLDRHRRWPTPSAGHACSS